jgi:hypothetical protein
MDTKVDQIKKIINAPDNVIRACLLKHQESVERALDELLQGKLMVTFFGLEAMGEFTLLGFHRVQKRKHCECFRKSKVFIVDHKIIPGVTDMDVDSPVSNLALVGLSGTKSHIVNSGRPTLSSLASIGSLKTKSSGAKVRPTLSSLASAGMSSNRSDESKPSLGSLSSMHLSNPKLSLHSKGALSLQSLPNTGKKLNLSSLQPGNRPNLSSLQARPIKVPQFNFTQPEPEPIRKKVENIIETHPSKYAEFLKPLTPTKKMFNLFIDSTFNFDESKESKIQNARKKVDQLATEMNHMKVDSTVKISNKAKKNDANSSILLYKQSNGSICIFGQNRAHFYL